MFVATLVADSGFDESLLAEVAHQFDSDCTAGRLRGFSLIENERAGDLIFEAANNFTVSDCSELAEAIREMAQSIAAGGYDREMAFDVIVQPVEHRQKKLLIADMDSTMITVECIDELADYVGLKSQVSAVTERAMRGEIDFAGALRDRVALLAGLSEATVAECLRERVKLMGGAIDLVAAFRAAGGRAVLVSGGFTHFTDSVAKQIGFDRAVANRLVVKEGALTGEVEWPIVDAQTKRETLLAEAAALGIPVSATVAIGDGANDIPMIEAAGLGVAYHAKPRTEAAADARVRRGNLNVVRYALGLVS